MKADMLGSDGWVEEILFYSHGDSPDSIQFCKERQDCDLARDLSQKLITIL